MDIKRIDGNRFRINDVEMDGRKHDFIFRISDRQFFYRESDHLGGTFAPISDNSRYKMSVRKTLRKVACIVLAFNG